MYAPLPGPILRAVMCDILEKEPVFYDRQDSDQIDHG